MSDPKLIAELKNEKGVMRTYMREVIPGTLDDLIKWPGPEIATRFTRAEAATLYDALDSLIPQGEHRPDVPGYLGDLPLQRFMYFLRTGERIEFIVG
jgi:hypothetical protein